jgi:hypothetical protein
LEVYIRRSRRQYARSARAVRITSPNGENRDTKFSREIAKSTGLNSFAVLRARAHAADTTGMLALVVALLATIAVAAAGARSAPEPLREALLALPATGVVPGARAARLHAVYAATFELTLNITVRRIRGGCLTMWMILW